MIRLVATFHSSIHVNPARAGMIPASSWAVPPLTSKPRASGDDPSVQTEKQPFLV